MNLKIIFFSILLVPFSSKAFIFQIDVLEKDGQRIYLMYDDHIPKKTDITQVKETISVINEFKAFTILEDVLGAVEREGLVATPKKWKFIHEFREKYFNECLEERKYNPEFRVKAHSFISGELKLSSVLDELYEQIQEISKYNDNVCLNDLYSKIIKDLYKRMEIFDKAEYMNYKREDFIASKDIINKVKEQIKEFGSVFDSVGLYVSLALSHYTMEAKIIHKIYNSQNEKHIFIILGGAHCLTLENVLTKLLGYKKIKSSGKHLIDLYGNISSSLKALDVKRFFNELEKEDKKPTKIKSKL